jgi:cytochrome c553
VLCFGNTPTLVAWTRSTLDQIAAGNAQRGAFIALNCAACHGQAGVSSSSLIPTLAGIDAAVVCKQLDDYRKGKRLWGAWQQWRRHYPLKTQSTLQLILPLRQVGCRC